MTDTNRTPYNQLPDEWAFHPEKGPFWRDILDQLRQLRDRSGGDDDAVEAADTKELFSWQGVADRPDARAIFGFRENSETHRLPTFFSALQPSSSEKTDFISTGSNHTTAGNEIVEATAAITVTLNATPDAAETVKTKRNTTAGTVTIDGNGKNVDGASTASLLYNYETITVIYSPDSDEWLII